MWFATFLGIACDSAADKAPPGGDSANLPVADSGDSAGDTADSSSPDTPVLRFVGAPPRNVLILSLDTTNKWVFGRYSGLNDTPTLDALAAGGMVMESARSCSSWTFPSMVCALTGARPEQLGFYAGLGEELAVKEPVPAGTATYASELAAAGFETALVTSNFYFTLQSGLAYGFTRSFEDNSMNGELVTSKALEYADEMLATGKPYLLQAHYIDPHTAYRPPDSYRSELAGRPELPWDLSTDMGTRELGGVWASLSEEHQAEALAQLKILYRGEVKYMDDQIALLLDGLRERGMLEDTLIVVYTDHGESMYEHGRHGHGSSLYAAENDTVLYFWAPNIVPGVWQGMVNQQDILPTLLTALNLPVPNTATGLPAGIAQPERVLFPFYWHGDYPVAGAMVGRSKLVYSWDGSKSLYLRDVDPGEFDNVYDPTNPEMIALWERFAPEIELMQSTLQVPPPVNVGP